MIHTSLDIGDAVYPSGRRKHDSDIRKGGKPWGVVIGKPRSNIYTVMWSHGRSHSNHMRQTLVKKGDLESYPRFSRWYDGTVCHNSVTNAWYSNRIRMSDDFSTPMQRKPRLYDEVSMGLSVEDFFKKVDKIDREKLPFTVFEDYFTRPMKSEHARFNDWWSTWCNRPKSYRKPKLKVDVFNPFKEHRTQLDSFLSKHSRRRR